jgi:threonine/homoserine/homoserine lactone efflux protein
MIVNLGEFVAVSALLIIAPGLDTALIMRNALLHGRRVAVATALGVNTGMALWTLATALGLAALLEASAVAFTVVKVLGASYLIGIGLATLVASRRRGREARASQLAPAPLSATGGYRQGLLCNVANPKAAVIFTSLLPQFVAGAHPSALPFLALGAIFTAIALVLQGGYAIAAAAASRLLMRSRVRALVDRLTGVVLIALGVKLATLRR